MVSKSKIEELKKIAANLRHDVIDMIHKAESGHPGGALSAADIVTALYFYIMNIDPSKPQWPERDRFIMSKGHACPIWYVALATRGYFDKSNLDTLRKINSKLQGHPDMLKTPGIDMTTGSLGNGLSAGVGMALSAKYRKKGYYTYVLIGCSEHDEGILWEAVMSAYKFKLDNLIAIVDYNKLQLDGYNYQVMPIEPLEQKWQAFNWNTIRIDGHNMSQIINAINTAKKKKSVPTVIIADTIKGKGVSFMENKCDWHGKVPDINECRIAFDELAIEKKGVNK